jgi:hypothetical protein
MASQNTRTGENLHAPAGYGISITLIAGVLLALSYYAVVAIQAGAVSGPALPEPIYLLAAAVLFVLELVKSRDKGLIALGRAALFAAIFGVLLGLGVEGTVYLVAQPGAALDGYVGVLVLSVALVVAALGYFCYWSAVVFDRRRRVSG